METQPQTSRSYFRILNMIFFAQLAGPVLFAAVTMYVHTYGSMEAQNELIMPLKFIVPTLLAGCLVAMNIIPKIILKKAKVKPGLKEKLAAYQVVAITRIALMEGSALFGVVAYFLTANLVFLALAGMALLFMSFYRPTRDKAALELELDQSEKAMIHDPDAIVAEKRIV